MSGCPPVDSVGTEKAWVAPLVLVAQVSHKRRMLRYLIPIWNSWTVGNSLQYRHSMYVIAWRGSGNRVFLSPSTYITKKSQDGETKSGLHDELKKMNPRVVMEVKKCPKVIRYKV